MPDAPFWETTPLDQMTRPQWESLCDGCGRCCLHKLRDDDDGALSWTNVSCRLLDANTCRCSHYERRQEKVPDCVSLTPTALREIDWLPPSCAYRRVAEGRGLAWWHPLVSGDPATVHAAGVSVRGRVVNERRAGPLEHYITEWPGRDVKGRKPASRLPRGERRGEEALHAEKRQPMPPDHTVSGPRPAPSPNPLPKGEGF